MDQHFKQFLLQAFEQEIWANAHETRNSLQQFRFSSLAENWTCVAARNRQKIHKTPYFGVQGHWIQRQSRASVRLSISD